MAGPVFTLIWARGLGPFPSFSFSRLPSSHTVTQRSKHKKNRGWGKQRGAPVGVKHPLLFSPTLPVSRVQSQEAPQPPACCCLSPGSPHRIRVGRSQ